MNLLLLSLFNTFDYIRQMLGTIKYVSQSWICESKFYYLNYWWLLRKVLPVVFYIAKNIEVNSINCAIQHKIAGEETNKQNHLVFQFLKGLGRISIQNRPHSANFFCDCCFYLIPFKYKIKIFQSHK